MNFWVLIITVIGLRLSRNDGNSRIFVFYMLWICGFSILGFATWICFEGYFAETRRGGAFRQGMLYCCFWICIAWIVAAAMLMSRDKYNQDHEDDHEATKRLVTQLVVIGWASLMCFLCSGKFMVMLRRISSRVVCAIYGPPPELPQTPQLPCSTVVTTTVTSSSSELAEAILAEIQSALVPADGEMITTPPRSISHHPNAPHHHPSWLTSSTVPASGYISYMQYS